MKIKSPGFFDAVLLGVCSIAAQTVFVRLILSSPTAGELFAAIAIGSWIGAVGLGAFLGGKISPDRLSRLWLFSSLVKLPAAFLIFIYPVFFTGILDPLRFPPIVLIGIAPQGILYGLLFAVLIKPYFKTSQVYRVEAAGSFAGGILAVVWLFFGLGDFGLLIFLSFVEFSRTIRGRLVPAALGLAGLVLGMAVNPFLDRLASDIRWPGYETIRVAHGFSGLWVRHRRQDQVMISHNGKVAGFAPDRVSSEEALLWPFIFKPRSTRILLIGFEGLGVAEFLPGRCNAVFLAGDAAYLKLADTENLEYVVADPLYFSASEKFDIVCVRLPGSLGLGDYRMETDLFFKKCRSFLKDDGILFVSAVSDENYIAGNLALYLSSLKNTLEPYFGLVLVIPGPRAGFLCFKNPGSGDICLDPVSGFHQLNFESPYFNMPLIFNRLAPFRLSNFTQSITVESDPNTVFKPSTALNYLIWQGSAFGKFGRLFKVYKNPYPLLGLLLIFAVPVAIARLKKTEFPSISGVFNFGFLGMALEISVLYLFQLIFGLLHLHIGLIISVFMAGMALGAYSADIIKRWIIPAAVFTAIAAIFSVRFLLNAEFGLIVSLIMLYMISIVSGFSTGAGFAFFANIDAGGRGRGATLYGADLYGAMLAALIVPGILISSGTNVLIAVMLLVAIPASATLSAKKE